MDPPMFTNAGWSQLRLDENQNFWHRFSHLVIHHFVYLFIAIGVYLFGVWGATVDLSRGIFNISLIGDYCINCRVPEEFFFWLNWKYYNQRFVFEEIPFVAWLELVLLVELPAQLVSWLPQVLSLLSQRVKRVEHWTVVGYFYRGQGQPSRMPK